MVDIDRTLCSNAMTYKWGQHCQPRNGLVPVEPGWYFQEAGWVPGPPSIPSWSGLYYRYPEAASGPKKEPGTGKGIIAWESLRSASTAAWSDNATTAGEKVQKTVIDHSLETRLWSVDPSQPRRAERNLRWKAQSFWLPLEGASDFWKSLPSSKSAHQRSIPTSKFWAAGIKWRSL